MKYFALLPDIQLTNAKGEPTGEPETHANYITRIILCDPAWGKSGRAGLKACDRIEAAVLLAGTPGQYVAIESADFVQFKASADTFCSGNGFLSTSTARALGPFADAIISATDTIPAVVPSLVVASPTK